MEIKTIFAATVLLVTAYTQSAHATLVNGSTLDFFAAPSGTSLPAVGTGSWWAFPDVNLYQGTESFDGLIVGTTQLASGSHFGAPDGTESPAIDKAWQAFGNLACWNQ